MGSYTQCPACSKKNGSYSLSCNGSTKEDCLDCGKTGKITVSEECQLCGGEGKFIHALCSGTGHTTEWKNCTAHNTKDAHYYCALGTDNHGTNVSEYH